MKKQAEYAFWAALYVVGTYLVSKSIHASTWCVFDPTFGCGGLPWAVIFLMGLPRIVFAPYALVISVLTLVQRLKKKVSNRTTLWAAAALLLIVCWVFLHFVWFCPDAECAIKIFSPSIRW